MTRRSLPPRFVVRTTIAMFGVVAFVLSAVLLVLGLNVRDYVRGTVSEKLKAGQRRDDTYRAEVATGDTATRRELVRTIEREVDKLAARIAPDVLAVSDARGRVLAVAGRRRSDWPEQRPLRRGTETFVTLPGGVFRIAAAPIAIGEVQLGALELATALDGEYAREVSVLSRTSTVIVTSGRVVASTLPPEAASGLTADVVSVLGSSNAVTLGGSRYAVQLLFDAGDAAVFALDSIDASAGPATTDAVRAIAAIAVGAFALAGLASAWMARSLARPIDTLSRSLSEMTRSRNFDDRVLLTGSTREVDTLTDTFNTMMQSVAAAEAETRSAYVGAIRALAQALDARDPYTAGHSERVSAISVAIGREMAVPADQLEVLRLGALLHDIGKIGVSDNVLRKAGPLTPDEYETIKRHPTLGARILRGVPFLAPHLQIVELHHERPDGKGYPHGLRSDETPLLAQIVHVADAFDAMTSARAYRPGRAFSEALRELWRCAGTQFDGEIVQALAKAVPAIDPVHARAGLRDAADIGELPRLAGAARH